jgi:hypothetical protein
MQESIEQAHKNRAQVSIYATGIGISQHPPLPQKKKSLGDWIANRNSPTFWA